MQALQSDDVEIPRRGKMLKCLRSTSTHHLSHMKEYVLASTVFVVVHVCAQPRCSYITGYSNHTENGLWQFEGGGEQSEPQ